jgi:YfiH family protein
MLFEPDVPLGNGIVCFTTSIHGGLSKHNYFSLNVGAHVLDKQLHVDKNRALVATMLSKKAAMLMKTTDSMSVAPLKWLLQEHTSQLSDYHNVGDFPCDGVFTSHTNTPLVVMTADCMPVVIYCSLSHKLMTVHAGWRGLLNGILEAAIASFDSPNHLNVWIGPSISQDNFEVSHDVIHLFERYQMHSKAAGLQGKWKIDLPNIASQILREAGLIDIQISPHCTYQNKDCFSHRRAGHTGFKNTGRMATIAMRVG